MRKHSSTLISAILGLLFSQQLFAIGLFAPSQFGSCTAILRTVREEVSSVPQVSRSRTQEALNQLREFRVYTLKAGEAEPSSKAVRADSISSELKKRKVAQRIRGIELAAQGKAEGYENLVTAENEVQNVFGFIVSGKKNIQKLLNTVQARIQEFDRRDLSDKVVQSAVLDFIGAICFYQGVFHGKHVALDFVLGSVMAWMGLDSLFSPTYKTRGDLPADLKALEKNLEALGSAELNHGQVPWYYWSQTHHINKDALTRAWSSEPLTDADLSRETFYSLGPETLLIPARMFIKMESVSVHHDWLLTTDQKTGQPALHVFVRASVNEPTYPSQKKKKRLLTEWMETLPETGPQPVPIPGKQQ